MSTSEWGGWKEWVKIRGPVGLDRWDYYVKLISLHAGKPYPEDNVPTLADLRMPWDPEPSAATTKSEKPRHDSIFVPSERRIRTTSGFGQ